MPPRETVSLRASSPGLSSEAPEEVSSNSATTSMLLSLQYDLNASSCCRREYPAVPCSDVLTLTYKRALTTDLTREPIVSSYYLCSLRDAYIVPNPILSPSPKSASCAKTMSTP